tara:strand:- start:15 stop:245 length:231 start_codon:yes stop_codon:yes gene_type:complete
VQIIGGILVLVSIADFLLGNFANINLTYFLGQFSAYSPFVIGGLGLLLMNANKVSSSSDDPALDRFREKPKKSKKK